MTLLEIIKLREGGLWGLQVGAQDLTAWEEARFKVNWEGGSRLGRGPGPRSATFTSSKGNRSWKMRLIRAPPESSSVSTWSPEPSILFSKSTPNCWTILWGKKKSEYQSRGTDTALELCPKSSHGLLSSFYFFGNKMHVWVKKNRQNPGAVEGKHSLHARPLPQAYYDHSFIELGTWGAVITPFCKRVRCGRGGDHSSATSALRFGLIQQDCDIYTEHLHTTWVASSSSYHLPVCLGQALPLMGYEALDRWVCPLSLSFSISVRIFKEF